MDDVREHSCHTLPLLVQMDLIRKVISVYLFASLERDPVCRIVPLKSTPTDVFGEHGFDDFHSLLDRVWCPELQQSLVEKKHLQALTQERESWSVPVVEC